jgi:hypothetical protein
MTRVFILRLFIDPGSDPDLRGSIQSIDEEDRFPKEHPIPFIGDERLIECLRTLTGTPVDQPSHPRRTL